MDSEGTDLREEVTISAKASVVEPKGDKFASYGGELPQAAAVGSLEQCFATLRLLTPVLCDGVSTKEASL